MRPSAGAITAPGRAGDGVAPCPTGQGADAAAGPGRDRSGRDRGGRVEAGDRDDDDRLGGHLLRLRDALEPQGGSEPVVMAADPEQEQHEHRDEDGDEPRPVEEVARADQDRNPLP